MNTSEIDQLLAEKGNPCISIVLPTYRYAKARLQNPVSLEKAVMKAKSLVMNSAWPREQIQDLISKLDSIADKIHYMRIQEGLGIFVSPNIFKIQLLPFEVKEKIILGKTFEVRDLIYFDQFLKPYLLLTISKKRIRLFKGTGRDLQEMNNTDFPKQYKEEYEYSHPSVGSSYSAGLKEFERDKSIMQDTRLKAFIKQGDKTLQKYLRKDIPLFLAGVEKDLADFEQISQHPERVKGKLYGNYDSDAIHPLAEMAWNKIQKIVRVSHNETLSRVREALGRRQAVDGIRNVWNTATKGQGVMLLLEKDYQISAYYTPEDTSRIFLSPPVGNYEIIPDAADDVIEIVKAKGGDVTIFENGELEDLHQVALLLRYES